MYQKNESGKRSRADNYTLEDGIQDYELELRLLEERVKGEESSGTSKKEGTRDSKKK